ncbi:SGNH/GDSL hydrolase family protein [Solibacillus merdavium]|uniref:SGNH/GDSL hydrolase family protein n=1 Tax=Solibacillus merdavium TaxID=2762218 RepID=A0ABR8XQK5_9BACL|nr:SGNH/GDSL hydrolase family protein [Solibacillus merdavium]MBD8034233.1 SGNH/GDSL hydrolase family protein [Solibacillus merdavium]
MRKIILSIIFCVVLFPTATLADERDVYIALGDSLAAGQTPYSEIDAGYTDFIALQLMRNGKLAHFSKELTFPGYRVENVIETVQSDKAEQLLNEATLITISAGANNLLPLIAHNPEQGTIAFSQLSADFALNEVRIQMKELLSLTKEKAPNAEIYVLGYYFPYVSLHEEQKQGAEKAVKLLNGILKQETEQAGYVFVDVFEAFNSGQADYLPSIQDIHPNQLGYRIMANEMLKKYSGNDFLSLPIDAMPAPNPKTFEEMLQMQQNELAVEESQFMALHYPDKPTPIYV